MEQHTLVGNITRDPELRFTNSGIAVASIGIAVNRRYHAEGEWRDDVTFYDAEVWKDQAEHVAAQLSKGQRVIAVGRFRNTSWETEAGEKRTTLRFVVNEIATSIRFGVDTEAEQEPETANA